MHSTDAHHTPITAGSKPKPGGESTPNLNFLGVAATMGWQLAVAVLVPIIGGYELDQHLPTAPWLTIAGFVLGLAGFVIVLKQTLVAVEQATRGGQS